jgi:eukaryotic-like serine/threonine-protein kinase
VVDRYEVLGEIAHGGMAAVYRVRRKAQGGFDRALAMKVLLPQLAADEKFVAMFLDEARIASQVQHPNVVQVFDLGEHAGTPFLVMELLRGRSLRHAMAHAIPLSIAVAIGIGAARGLHAAHEARDPNGKPLRVVHRDVSPQNIHVGIDGRVKVVDFGIAAARGRMTETATGEVKGKLRYLAPEQITRSRAVDRRIDVWALGVTLWELFASRPLFQGADEGSTMWNVLHQEIEPLREVPAEVGALVLACLAREPADRPASAQVVAERLEAALAPARPATEAEIAQWMESNSDREVETTVEPTTVAAIEARPRRSRWKGAILGAGLAVVATAAVTVWAISIGESKADSPATRAAASAAPNTREDDAPRVVPPESTASPQVARDSERGQDSPETSDVEFEVGSDVLVLLVDGVRHDERPLRLSLGPNETAEIELVGERGEIVRRTLSAADRDTKLRVRDRARRRRTAMEDEPSAMDLRSLAKNPYP